jgi:UDPglucose 6-dehydrogenase
MTISKIGIVGNGFVGNAVRQSVSTKYETLVYDTMPEKSTHGLEQIWDCDLVFVCLPTPMKTAAGAECDLSILEYFFENIPLGVDCIIAIKSTVPIGTTSRLQEKRKDLKIIHNPEFLTAANAVEDFAKSTRNIIGSDILQIDTNLIQFFESIQPLSKTQVVKSKESEMIKYFANTFLAMKVSYFNLVYDTCQTFECEYENVVEGVCTDERIGRSHTKVPGPDGQRGFGGTCFPKDINSLIYVLNQKQINTNFLTNIWEYNKMVREDWDWSRSSSATSHIKDKDIK